MKKILIYRDYGQIPDSVNYLKIWLESIFSKTYSIEFTDATSIIKLNALNNNVAALFMPGGFSKGFYEKLKGQGNNIIKKFISNGGLYYGICAGAYYACTHIQFNAKNYQLTSTDTLGLVPTVALGSIKELCFNNLYNNDALSSNACSLKLNNGMLHNCFYSGGPIFLNNNLESLATYNTLHGQQNAVVSHNYNKGKLILIATHPEFNDIEIKDYAIHSAKKASEVKHLKSISRKLRLSKVHKTKEIFDSLILRDLL
jgi:glutamine amidotransferase-like uncharacterized protein